MKKTKKLQSKAFFMLPLLFMSAPPPAPPSPWPRPGTGLPRRQPARPEAAIDGGADCVYLGLRDATNARNFAGLNFDEKAIARGIAYAHSRGRKVLLALNTYPQASNPAPWRSALDRAAAWGIDAVILADPGLMRYATDRHPQLRLHLSVQGSATNHDAINLYQQQFNIQRAVLPRVLSLEQVETGHPTHQCRDRGVWLWQPVRDGGGALRPVVLCHGRVAQHAWRVLAGQICALERHVHRRGIAPERRADRQIRPGRKRRLPRRCARAASMWALKATYYALEEPTSLNTLELLPQLVKMGVRAFKIEGRQRSPAYVAQVTKVWREAIDHCMAQGHLYAPKRPGWPASTRWPRASSTPWALTTGLGNNQAINHSCLRLSW